MSCLVDRDLGVRVSALAARSILSRGPAPARGAHLVRGALPHGRAQQSLLSSADPGSVRPLASRGARRLPLRREGQPRDHALSPAEGLCGTGPAVPRARLAAGRQARPHSLPATAHPALRPGTAPRTSSRRFPRAAWVVEFRHPSWQTAETYDALGGAGVALCVPVGGRVQPDLVTTAGFSYLRMHTAAARAGPFPWKSCCPGHGAFAGSTVPARTATSTSTTIAGDTLPATPDSCSTSWAQTPEQNASAHRRE